MPPTKRDLNADTYRLSLMSTYLSLAASTPLYTLTTSRPSNTSETKLFMRPRSLAWMR